ncbi:MAG: AI-2E family transporter [Desertimonas sp.]
MSGLLRAGRLGWAFVGIVAAVAVGMVLIATFRSIVTPLVLSGYLAVVLTPLVRWMTARRIPRALAAVGAVILLALVIAGAVIVVVFGLIDQADELGQRLAEAEQELLDLADGTWAQSQVTDLFNSLDDGDTSALFGISRGVTSLLDTVASVAAGIVLGVVLLYYLLKDGEQITTNLVNHVGPNHKQRTQRLMVGAATSMRAYFRGRSLLALIQGIAVAIGLAVLDVPLAGAVGVVNVIGAYIPYLGAFVGGAFAVLMGISDGGLSMGIAALVVVLFVNLVLENLLEPKLIGSSLRMHPIVVLLVTLAGGLVAGLPGLVLAAPTWEIGRQVLGELRGVRPDTPGTDTPGTDGASIVTTAHEGS